jgi:hypothetical protein
MRRFPKYEIQFFLHVGLLAILIAWRKPRHTLNRLPSFTAQADTPSPVTDAIAPSLPCDVVGECDRLESAIGYGNSLWFSSEFVRGWSAVSIQAVLGSGCCPQVHWSA